MKDITLIAKALGLDTPVDAAPLESLENAFRPLVQHLTWDNEPAPTFRAEETGE